MSDVGEGRGFSTTRWSLVVAASGSEGELALGELCERYWYPLYVFVRRQGRSAADAEDLTKAFFAKLLEMGWLGAADRERGRFRSFMLVAFKRFLANEWDRERAAKRGGGRTIYSLDTKIAESRFAAEPDSRLPLEREYEKRWAMTLLGRAMSGLRAEYESGGKVKDFEVLKGYLTVERGGVPYGEVAVEMGLSEVGARSAMSRMRKRFRDLFRGAIADTVVEPAEVDDEVRHVVAALSWEG
ncbi:MAG: sigma-70 family RNA polymerase sigma factor [Verrucomicrobiales bacterium]|nr:sigma-70 family RNA polymerase sigma factor [Verrucomicrobiales bacterium]